MTTPLWLTLARNEIGVKEGPGAKNNPTVLKYFADAGHSEIREDETPWCAAFVGAMLSRAGIKPSGSLMARSYLTYGRALDEPIVGAIAIFPRAGAPGSGHVTFVDAVSDDGETITGLGGNQHDSVCRVHFRTSEALAFRVPNNIVEFPKPEDDEPAPLPRVLDTPAAPVTPKPNPTEVRSPEELKAATAKLRANGSRTIDAQDKIEKATGLLAIVTAFTSAFKDLQAEVGPYLWVILAAGAAYIFYLTRHTKFSRADDALSADEEQDEAK